MACKAIERQSDKNFISIASLWEIAIKISLGKLDLHGSFDDLKMHIISNGFHVLPITFEDTVLVMRLPFLHRDPFDRIIIAQAQSNQLQLISKDSYFTDYGIKTVW